MLRIACACLCLTLAGCAGLDSGRPTTGERSPADAAPDGTVMQRVMGQDVQAQPLLPQPGDIWADVLPPAQPTPEKTEARTERAADPGATVGTSVVIPVAATPLKAPARAATAAAPQQVAALPSDRGSLLVQLAAAPSRLGAEAQWQRLRQQARFLTDGHHPAVSEAEVNGQHVWRLRAAGFADVAEASAFCSGIHLLKAGCWVVPPSAPIK